MSTGPGLAFVGLGILLLLLSSILHSNIYHVAAALIFALAIGAIKVLGRVDSTAQGTPLRGIIAMTDVLSLIVLCLATFAPLLVMVVHGHPGWDLMVLGGILLVWWNVLNRLVADYRRLRKFSVALACAWLPAAVLHPNIEQVAFISGGLGLAACLYSAIALRSSLKSVPREYRVVQTKTSDVLPD